MKKAVFILLLAAGSASAADDVITLDLTKATTTLEFNAENGSWNGTFNDDEKSIDSQVFSFIHSSMGEYDTWWGFTASNSANNAQQANPLQFQWSNMAGGGIRFDEDGKVTVDPAVPYIVGYYGDFFAPRPTDMVFTDGKSYAPQGVYVNLTSYPYYCLEYGMPPARAFGEGDKFYLVIHGVAPDESEKEVTVDLCSYTNGDITINRGWKYVDLTPLGTVNELYFTMDGTDRGDWGLNTPTYFALDKLSVKAIEQDNIISPEAAGITLKYNRADNTLSWTGAEFADVRNALGQTVMASDSGKMDLTSLPAGVYIARAGARTLKFAK